MKNCLFNKTIPVEPLSPTSNPAPFSKLPIREYRRVIQSYFPSLPQYPVEDSRFALKLVFNVTSLKTKQRPKADLDNLIKPILDAGTSYFWHDDNQVDEINAKIRRRCQKSSITIAIFRLKLEIEQAAGSSQNPAA